MILNKAVLILIVVEERIGSNWINALQAISSRLNPYCSGRKNRIFKKGVKYQKEQCLNPYCSGRKNRIQQDKCDSSTCKSVLILIVVEERIGS